MKLIFEGKTKKVYENENGTYTLKFKDDATGKDGVFDPGENAVGLSIEGLGRESLRLTAYYFEMLTAAGVPHHFISYDFDAATMDVKPSVHFGEGVEFICRRKADGSFVRRYGAYTSKGADLGCLIEATLKDNARQDPPISKESLAALGIMSAEEYETCAGLSRKITGLIAADLAKKGLELYDIKYEFAKSGGEVILIDEFSAGVMRVYKNGKIVPPMELGKLILG